MKKKLLTRLLEVEKYFTQEKYSKIVKTSRRLFEQGSFNLCEEELEELPSNAKLLANLVGKLKGKSVYKTLKRIQEGEGKIESGLVTVKALSSLLTHIIIECEQGNSEYKILVPSVTEKLNEVVYNTLQMKGDEDG